MTQINPNQNPLPLPGPDHDPDLPAESIRVRFDDDSVVAWLDALHPVYDRDDSTKGTTNPKSQLHHHHQNPNPNPNPNNQRFSGNLKATTKSQIIGLPGAAVQQHSGHIGNSARRHPPPIFPPKAGIRKPGVSVSDPGSPKVSCFGKVRTDGSRQRSPEGFWSGFLSCFGGREPAAEARARAEVAERNIPARASRDIPAVVPAEPPGLGGMRKLVSGRRSASWGGDVEVDLDGGEEGHVPWSGPLVRR